LHWGGIVHSRNSIGWCGLLLVPTIALAACDAPQSNAQQQVPSAMISDSVTAMMQNMTPAFGFMMQGMMEATLTVLERPETAERLASFTRNYYEALIAEGFTETQALQLAEAVGFPSVMGGR
jgi:hypothetical protein